MGIEQRKAKRVDVNAVISINRLNNGEFFHREDEEKFNVSIIDISETGLAFVTDRPIEVDSYYNTDLDFDGCERIKAVVQIVRMQDRKFSSVEADYFSCGYEAARYLAKKGCTKIAFINGSTEYTPYAERYRGYHKAMKELGLKEYQIKSGIPRGNYFKDGYQGVERIMEDMNDVDGIMVAADMQGIGVLRALKEAGKSVPDEVRVISLTGHSIGGMLETSMTSMEMPGREMGQRAADLILEDIEASKEDKPSVQHMVFGTKLMERETT